MSAVSFAVNRFDELVESMESATERVRDAALEVDERLDKRNEQLRELLQLIVERHPFDHPETPWAICSSMICRIAQELEAEIELEQ